MPTSTKKPNSRPVFRWLARLACLLLVISAVIRAFPRVIGSNDDPDYGLAVAFLGLAGMLGGMEYAKRLRK